MAAGTGVDDPRAGAESDDAGAAAGADDHERRLRRYLRERAAEEGEFFFKSKFIADEVGLSPSQIGTLVARLRESAEAFEIEKWSYTNATTWRVAPSEA